MSIRPWLNIFPFVGCFFILLSVFFDAHKNFFYKVQFFSFVDHAFGVISKNSRS